VVEEVYPKFALPRYQLKVYRICLPGYNLNAYPVRVTKIGALQMSAKATPVNYWTSKTFSTTSTTYVVIFDTSFRTYEPVNFKTLLEFYLLRLKAGIWVAGGTGYFKGRFWVGYWDGTAYTWVREYTLDETSTTSTTEAIGQDPVRIDPATVTLVPGLEFAFRIQIEALNTAGVESYWKFYVDATTDVSYLAVKEWIS